MKSASTEKKISEQNERIVKVYDQLADLLCEMNEKGVSDSELYAGLFWVWMRYREELGDDLAGKIENVLWKARSNSPVVGEC